MTRIKDLDEHYKILFISISILIIAGILPSIYNNDFIWFSKSGSLLVAYGIYIVWKDIKGKVDYALAQINKEQSKNFENSSEQLFNIIKKIRKENKNLYNLIEFLILATGTIITGYGDLINYLYK